MTNKTSFVKLKISDYVTTGISYLPSKCIDPEVLVECLAPIFSSQKVIDEVQEMLEAGIVYITPDGMIALTIEEKAKS